MTTDQPEILIVADVAAWRKWLDGHEETSDGVWLMLAKKGIVTPTSLSYAEALDEALCSGWIDGQRQSYNAETFRQRFTPRRKASIWSQRNVGLVAGLIAEGRMRTRGHSEITRAQEDGRWDRAYAGQSSVEVPEDLVAALAVSPAAAEAFAGLNSVNRYAILHRIITATTPQTRLSRLTKSVEMLERGETPY